MKYFHTARHLKPVQIYGRVTSRLPQSAGGSFAAPALRERAGEWHPAVRRAPARTGPFRFRFLNDEREIASWNDAGVPKLWLYNLHYFEAPEAELIARWIAENPTGAGNGWEPYPLSLRIANWIKFALSGGDLSGEAMASLAVQAEFLMGRVEYHLLGNHLLANAKALVFAGAFFGGDRAERWLTRGIAILNREIPEQILADGGHFERSPMYHSLILEDLLDLTNLAGAFGVKGVAQPEICGKMLAWLETMTHPDGQIALFNDAAFGIAATPGELNGYAGRLGISCGTAAPFLEQTGYMRMQIGDTVAFFDAAPIGPDYQPGHAHADTLSIEVSHRGRRVLVNSGTSTYQAGAERLRQRGTAAHNTVLVDGMDQSEVWGAFRVARRARPSAVSFHSEPGRVSGEASHDGYRRLANPLTHKRAVQLTAARIEITDYFDATASHLIQVFFHLHPDVEARVLDRNYFSLWMAGSEIGALKVDPALTCSAEPSAYHPEFGLAVPNFKLTSSSRATCPRSFKSTLSFV